VLLCLAAEHSSVPPSNPVSGLLSASGLTSSLSPDGNLVKQCGVVAEKKYYTSITLKSQKDSHSKFHFKVLKE
jgi:hypothetical protein